MLKEHNWFLPAIYLERGYNFSQNFIFQQAYLCSQFILDLYK